MASMALGLPLERVLLALAVVAVIAEFDGRCPACDESIVAGADDIARNADGEWCHEDCASE